MISFIQVPLRTSEHPAGESRRIRPVVMALILGLMVCFQIGLVLWIYLKQL